MEVKLGSTLEKAAEKPSEMAMSRTKNLRRAPDADGWKASGAVSRRKIPGKLP